MNLTRCVTIAAIWSTACLSGAVAQDALDQTYTRIYEVKHADAESVASAVSKVEGVVQVTWDGDTRLILRGAKPEVERVLETLIQPLDVPRTSLASRPPVAFIRLPRTPSGELMNLVQTVARSGARTQVALDRQNRLLVVRGAQADVDAVKQLVAVLDRPARRVTIRCYFLRGTMDGAASSGGADLPEDLEPIAATLGRAGLGEASLLAPLIISANDGARFQSSSALRLADRDGATRIVTFDVSGRATITGDRNAELMIQGRVKVPGDHDTGTWFEVDTTIATRVGSHVVMATAPSTTPNGDYIAMVAQVKPVE